MAVSQTSTPPAPEAELMLIDRLLPQFDATRIEHRVVAGAVDDVYEATRRADFLRTWRESSAPRFLFAARELGERAISSVRGRPFERPPEPDSLRLADMPPRGEWVLLGEDPPSEIAFGTVGRFWSGETRWEQIDAGDFAAFDRPGFGKIAANFSLRPYGADHTLVTYEARTKATDEEARRGFVRYWGALSPFVGVVMRTHLRAIEAEVGPA